MELRVVCQGIRSVHSLSILDSSGEPAFYHLFSPLPSYSYRTPTLHCIQGESCSTELIAIPENRTFLSLTPLPEGCTLLPSGILSCETDQQMSGVAFTIMGVWNNEELYPLHRHTTSLPPIATTQQTRSLDDCQRLHLLSEAAPDGYLNSMDCHVVTPSTLTSTPPPIYIPLHLSIARTLSLVSSSIARIQPLSSLRLFSDEHEIEDSITLPYACTHVIHPSL